MINHKYLQINLSTAENIPYAQLMLVDEAIQYLCFSQNLLPTAQWRSSGLSTPVHNIFSAQKETQPEVKQSFGTKFFNLFHFYSLPWIKLFLKV